MSTTTSDIGPSNAGVAFVHTRQPREALAFDEKRRVGTVPVFSVAPMMDCTDRHCRFLHRQLSRRVMLYTEMISPAAILHGEASRFLALHPGENPVALQLGGSDPRAMARCAELAEESGFDAVNINVGCPSDRVRSGKFGACLMVEPELVAACVSAMRARVRMPVTVKTRIGVDDRDSYEDLVHFVTTVAGAGCDTFIIHARKAWLHGLSPKQNREVPPLRYDVVRRLKRDHPALRIEINGGIRSLEEARAHLDETDGVRLDGVMMGRAVYENPYLLVEADALFHGDGASRRSREDVLEAYAAYADTAFARGARQSVLLKPLLGLYHAMPGARSWRRGLSDDARDAETPGAAIRDASRRRLEASPISS